MTKQSFLHGTLILVGAGFITKILGFVYRIALSRIIGDEGMGLFQMAFPILLFVIVLATAGLPVAISKLVSEAEATGDEERIRFILRVSLGIVIVTSMVLTGMTVLFAPWIASHLLTDERAVYALTGIAPVIPIVAIASIFRGYFQGRQQMNPYAVAQIVEQIVRIATILLLAQYLLPYGVEYASAGAMFGIVAGEGAGLFVLLRAFRNDPRRPPLRMRIGRKDSVGTLKRLSRLALPVTASRTFGSLSYAVEPIVVSQSLAIAGIATATATALYGQLEGMAIPLVYFPAFITYALSVSLVPAVSEAAARGQRRLVEHRLRQAVRLSLIVGAPCAVWMFVLAEPLTLLVYHNTEVARLMQILAPFAVFLYLQGPLAAVLQGLDKANEAMRNSIFGSLIKTGLIFLFASRPSLGIDGVALAINCGIVIVTSLHLLSIMRHIPFTVHLKGWIKLTVCIAGMGTVSYLWLNHSIGALWLRLLSTVGVSAGVYGALLILFSLIRGEDARHLPVIGKWMNRLLPR
ncbi:stage V sporulation protein B [Polycladomyces zharkentensis]|uniref:stage V sporulation protein B n=1 Tax=Polycladomyces zharkentensis TaxID=2807616 RepID=UPI002FF69C65